MGNVSKVPIDDDFGMMLNWAVRYSLGRRTYAVSSACDYITPLVSYLSDKTLWCIQRDISERRDRPEGSILGDLGDECDRRDWLRLLDVVEAELERRHMEPDTEAEVSDFSVYTNEELVDVFEFCSAELVRTQDHEAYKGAREELLRRLNGGNNEN